MGSIAFGSFIVAVVWAIKIIFEFISVITFSFFNFYLEKNKGCRR